MNGLGPAINLGSSNLDVGTNGLTLEAWVWVPNTPAVDSRKWQKIFDIGRGQGDQTIVFGYSGTTGQIDLQLYSNCSTPASSNSVINCSNQNTNSTLFDVPYNGILATDSNQFNASSPNDLWYYIAAIVQPEDTVNHQTSYSIYTACQASQVSTTNAVNSCTSGTVQTNSNFGADSSQNLRLRTSGTWSWTNGNTMVGAAYRQVYMGYSFWSDPYFQGMLKNIRVWNTALTAPQLGAPLNPSYTVDNKTSTLISNTSQNQSLRISPLYSNGNDRLLLFTAQENGQTFNNTYRLVSCAWSTKVAKRVTRSVRFRVVGNNRPEVIEYLAY